MTEIETASLWRHKKTGHIYQVGTLCTIEATDTPAVAYKSVSVADRNDIWIRPFAEFLDGRFERLGTWDEVCAAILSGDADGKTVSENT